MVEALDRNRLDEEQSPYLRQHADNPVHWQPWDDVALEAATELERPIFLSIGYAACHWCHVMEEESFMDDAIADRLNRSFVPIKVDREERPDIDRIYQTIAQLVTGRGGWPLSVWLLPDGRPFYVGTYFPPEAKRGMPGFADLLERIDATWRTDRAELETRAADWSSAIEDHFEPDPPSADGPPGESALLDAANASLQAADPEYGGFGRSGPKFPQPARTDVLLRAYEKTEREAYLDVASLTLDAMATGGLFDHLGGGFHRYATDRTWTVPHFEKMLYDNAELARLFLAGYQVTGTDRYRDRAERTFSFVERELTHPDGGFYSTLDAQSGGEEGAFYVWSPETARAAIDDEAAADCFIQRYGITEAGNFEGKTVLTVQASIDDIASDVGLSAAEVTERLEAARTQALAAREHRERPRRDEKVLAGWNGLMIAAFARAALVLEPGYADGAERSLAFVREHLWEPGEHRLMRRYADGVVTIPGFLEDYAFLARGAFELYQATGEQEPLHMGLALSEAMVDRFWDPASATLYLTAEDASPPVTRPQEPTDQAIPSSLAVAADVLLTASQFDPGGDLESIVERLLTTHAHRLESAPIDHPSLAMVADRFQRGPAELTIAADRLPAGWRERLAERYRPSVILSRRPPTDEGLQRWLDALELEGTPPIWRGRAAVGDGPTVYACQSFTCSRPLSDLEAALEWLEGADETAGVGTSGDEPANAPDDPTD